MSNYKYTVCNSTPQVIGKSYFYSSKIWETNCLKTTKGCYGGHLR